MKKFILLGIIIAASHLWCSQLQAQIFKGFNAFSVKDEVITEQEWTNAVQHRDEYNCCRDTMDWYRRKAAEVAVFKTLDDEDKTAYVWTDLWLTNIGMFVERNETIVEIWHANDMEAVFVENGVADTCRIAGSDFGVYSKDGIFVGCKGFDCDNHVHLFFYQHVNASAQCHIRLLGEYTSCSAYLQNYNDENALAWYKGSLYWTGYDRYPAGKETRTFHKLSFLPSPMPEGGKNTFISESKAYIDLGLPSGTLWCNLNEEGLYTHDDAVIRFGDALPTTEQWKELQNSCQWTWNGNGYKIVGPNGASIILPAAGRRLCDGTPERGDGYYWSATPFVKDNLTLTFDELFFTPCTIYLYYSSPCNEHSVRLIRGKVILTSPQ